MNTVNDTCFLKRLNRYVDLEVSKTDLYLIDLTHLCAEPTSHQKVFDNAVVHEGLVTESKGVDSSNKGHERVSSCVSHNFVHSIKDSVDSSHVHVSNFDSKLSIDRDSDLASSLISSKHAESNDDDLERCRRIHDRILMTMLLQILISQLEVSNLSEMTEEPDDVSPEMRQTLENMVQELQNHRNILQGLMANQQAIQNQVARPVTGSVGGSNLTPTPGGTGANRGQATRPPRALPNVNLQALPVTQSSHPRSPTGTAVNSTWILAEEEELIEERISVIQATVPTAAPTTPATRPMSVSEQGQKIITWGRKHKGKTWLEVFQTDLGYQLQVLPLFSLEPWLSYTIPLVSGSLWKSPSRSTRVCPFLPDENRSRSSSQWPMTKSLSNDVDQLSHVDFDQEVNQVRDVVSKPLKPDDQFFAIKSSLNSAESILEEV